MIIYKYPIPLVDDFKIAMPLGAKILSFQEQQGQMMIWAAVCPNSSLEDRIFKLVGTGEEIDMGPVKKHIGTVQQLKGSLVWHLFEVIS